MYFQKFVVLVMFCVCTLSVRSWAEEGLGGRHGHAEATHNDLRLDGNKKWKSDKPLRSAMARIHASIEENREKIYHGKMKDEEYVKLAGAVDAQISYIFKNCKLKPEADRVLHQVLIKMMAGSKEMKEDPTPEIRHSGTMKVVDSLSDYGTYFSDEILESNKKK